MPGCLKRLQKTIRPTQYVILVVTNGGQRASERGALGGTHFMRPSVWAAWVCRRAQKHGLPGSGAVVWAGVASQPAAVLTRYLASLWTLR